MKKKLIIGTVLAVLFGSGFGIGIVLAAWFGNSEGNEFEAFTPIFPSTRAQLRIEPVDYVLVELGEPTNLQPIDFVANRHMFADSEYGQILSDINYLASSGVGMHSVFVLVNEQTFTSYINVVDTMPPVAVTTDLTIVPGTELFPEDFFVSITDSSPITNISFLNAIDILASGDHIVAIHTEDAFGNQSVHMANLTILPNQIPPVIRGARDLEVMIGNPAMFRLGVGAFDAFGREIDLNIFSRVDLGEIGTYSLTFSAEDAWGLTVEETVNVQVIDVDPEWVYERVDYIFESIMNEGMTQVEMARAIFDWVDENVRFAVGIDSTSVYENARQALLQRQGNCFVFYSLSSVMLTRAGVPNMRINRIPDAPTWHTWNLINPDDLGWHHFDASPSILGLNRFMFTSGEAAENTRRLFETGRIDFFTYDPTLYPEIVW